MRISTKEFDDHSLDQLQTLDADWRNENLVWLIHSFRSDQERPLMGRVVPPLLRDAYFEAQRDLVQFLDEQAGAESSRGDESILAQVHHVSGPLDNAASQRYRALLIESITMQRHLHDRVRSMGGRPRPYTFG